ncbi:peroxisomal carnitine O-octanoyltransferase-like isoform X2 [Panonychus citri]|nr:peroxisomal carnitine O-octanoyltransferase-like isoform X2 [Panonychus citri]
MSVRDQLYRSTTNKTFENEADLPSLPVPSLQSTLDLYLDTVKAVTNQEEYENTKKIVGQFISTDGPKIQNLLIERSQKSRNWLEDWWLNYAYLQQRSPLIPYCNMAAPYPIHEYWPPQRGSRVNRISLSLAYELEFWKMLRSQIMRPMVHRGVPWAMDQFKRLFNTCRIPGEERDSLNCWFITEDEGPPAPTNIIVLYRGYIFSFEAVDPQLEEPLTPQEIAFQLFYIEKWCQSQATDGPGVGALTVTDRSQWAKNRDYLIKLNTRNKKTIDRIEQSLFVIVFDDSEPTTQSQLLREAMCGDCKNRWADKSMSTIVFNNGLMGASGDHTPFDGLCTAILSHYIMISLDESKGVWKGSQKFREMPKAERLEFILDDYLIKEIDCSVSTYNQNCSDIQICHETFKGFGKAALRDHKFHPEAFTQVALQLAYYRMHGKPAPTYCTASTRQYYHGRTETCRSCFPESVEFCKSVIESKKSPGELYNQLSEAVSKFTKLMGEAMKGFGCDRHLMGLYLTCLEEGLELPDLFTDPSFIASGGGGNYILSTSCSGYWHICGGVPPMRDDGYGAFYGIEDNQITFCITAYKKCSETDPKAFFDNVAKSLMEMQQICISSKL